MNLSQAAKQLFSLSRDKRHDVNGQPNQTVSLSGTAIDYVSSIIKNDAAAALLAINKKGNVVAIYAPQLSTDLTGTNVVSIVGNASNKVGEFSLVSMDAKEVTHTVVLLGREAAEQTGLQLKDSIPAKVLEDTDLVGDGQNYLIAIPTVVPLFFGQEPPSGMITGATTMDQFEMLGSGYAAYQTGMAEAIELVENTSRILNHQTISQDLQRYVANLPPSVTAFTSVPYVFIENVSSDLFPDQAAKLRPLFLPDSNHVDGISSSRVLSTGAILRTQEDVDKQTQANDDANKTHLRHCGADIDFEACTITNLTNAIMTSGYSDLSKKTGSARASACQILLSSVFTKSKQGSAFDVRTQVSIDVFPATFVTMLLTNTWTTTNVMATHPQQNCITVAHFFPQNSSSESVQSTIKNERERANERNAGQQNQREKATLKILGDLRSEEDMLKTIVNMLATVRAFVDNEAMEARGRPCVLHTILTSLLAWVQKVIGDLPKWRRDTGHDMKHFPFVLFSIVESMMIKFTEFTNDLGNLNHYKNGSLADLDVSGIVGMLQIFKLARKDIAHKIALTQPHTSVPACAPHSSAQQDPIQHRGLAPAITPTPSPTDTAGGSPEQRSAKKPRIDTPSQGRVTARRNLPRAFDPKTRGWLFPANGKHPRDIIPSSTNICPFFVSRGYACEENCGKQHLANIAHVPRDDMISILDTLLATKAGWVNKNQVTRQFGRKYNPVFGPPDDQTADSSKVCGPSINSSDQLSFDAALQSLPNSSFLSARPSSIARQTVPTASRINEKPISASGPPSSIPDQRAARHQRQEPLPPANSIEKATVPGTSIKNKAERDAVLRAYEQKHGRDGNPIVTKNQGKGTTLFNPSSLPTQRVLVKNLPYKPTLKHSYRVSDLSFDLITLPLLASRMLDDDTLEALSRVTSRHSELVDLYLRLLHVELSPIFDPRDGYADQVHLDLDRIEMASALFLHYGGDPGKVVRALNQEYLLSSLDRKGILARVKGLVSEDDYRQMQRILFTGCPSHLVFEETNEERLTWFLKGNQPSYIQYPVITRQAINKEEKNSHVIPISSILATFSPFCRHTPQGLIPKNGVYDASARVVWDGSTKLSPSEIALNEVSDMTNEAPITFGSVESSFDRDLYNLRVSLPQANILLATLDIKACFRFPRIAPDLAGAFGFLSGDDLFCLANAMVFGHSTSAQSWEPFRRAIELLTVAFADSPHLVDKHRQFLDMISWNDQPSPEYVKASPCTINCGIYNSDGTMIPRPSRMYVDDALLAAAGRIMMERQLAATIEAFFVIRGDHDEALRQCALALDKWRKLTIGPQQIFLGLQYDTIQLTKGITSEYRISVISLLDSSWASSRTHFTAREAQELVGKIARLAKGARWVFHILSHMYDQIALALSSNKKLLHSSSAEFRALTAMIKNGSTNRVHPTSRATARLTNWALKRAAQMVHRSKYHYPITEEMRSDIELFRHLLQPHSGVRWMTPIAHVIERNPFAHLFGDSSLQAAGGFSVGLKFWWHLPFPEEVVKRTLLHMKDDSSNEFISINALEFITIILNYAAAITVFAIDKLTDDPFPVLLGVTDNTSALNWVNHACKGSPLGRALARLFVGLLITSNIGINAKWISTTENKIADEISRLKKLLVQIPTTSELSFLGAVAAASLHDLEHRVNEEVARSQRSHELDTERSRQAFYLKWCENKDVSEPVGEHPGYQTLVGAFILDVIDGNNYYSKNELRSKTVEGYAKAVNTLFALRNCPLPVDFADPGNKGNILIRNLAVAENVANQRNPLSPAIVAEIIKAAQNSHHDSAENAVLNILAIGRLLGFRISEYGQTQQNKIDYHTYANKKTIIKAFLFSDWESFSNDGNKVNLAGLISSMSLEQIYEMIDYVSVCWRIQKNRKNGQKVKVKKDLKNKILCPVWNALQIILRKFRIDRSNINSTPLCVFRAKKGDGFETRYLTGAKVADVIRKAVKRVHPDVSKEELNKYSAHSIRVWACVLMDQANMKPMTIKARLRWLGNSFELYLRDTSKINEMHRNSVSNDAAETLGLVTTISAGTDDPTLHYVDEMD